MKTALAVEVAADIRILNVEVCTFCGCSSATCRHCSAANGLSVGPTAGVETACSGSCSWIRAADRSDYEEEISVLWGRSRQPRDEWPQRYFSGNHCNRTFGG
jgi:hypothetical protein